MPGSSGHIYVVSSWLAVLLAMLFSMLVTLCPSACHAGASAAGGVHEAGQAAANELADASGDDDAQQAELQVAANIALYTSQLEQGAASATFGSYKRCLNQVLTSRGISRLQLGKKSAAATQVLNNFEAEVMQGIPAEMVSCCSELVAEARTR
jgi:hypothetical protein